VLIVLTIKVDTGTGGVAATFAVGTVNKVVKSVVVRFAINLLKTSAIEKPSSPS
jgi:hypothetical protein